MLQKYLSVKSASSHIIQKICLVHGMLQNVSFLCVMKIKYYLAHNEQYLSIALQYMKQQKATRILKILKILRDPCWAVGQLGEIQTEYKVVSIQGIQDS